MRRKIQYSENSLKMNSENRSIIFDLVSSMISDLLFVFDFAGKSFIYNILKNDLLSFSHTDVALDYEYLKNIVYPKDRDFLEDVFNVITASLNNKILLIDTIGYFSFLLRLNTRLSSKGKYSYFMTYVKLKPIWEYGQLKYGICLLSSSVIRKQDNQIFVYYKSKEYSIYSFRTNEWEHFSFSPLTNRQNEMLMWAQQGFSMKETALKMNISDKTVENIRSSLFEKFGVSSIEQAIQYASNRRLIDYCSFTDLENKNKNSDLYK